MMLVQSVVKISELTQTVIGSSITICFLKYLTAKVTLDFGFFQLYLFLLGLFTLGKM